MKVISHIMDKLTLNNEIVNMRHAVRQAKVCVISKLVRESKKLKAKKGTDQQKEKNRRKAERFSEEIIHIKKLKDDDISKFVLSNMKSPAEILADISVPLETRTLARLAASKSLSDKILKFRAQFPTWDLVLPCLLDEIGAKRKRNGIKKSKKKVARIITQNIGSNKQDTVREELREASNAFEEISVKNENNSETAMHESVDESSDHSDSLICSTKTKWKISHTDKNNIKSSLKKTSTLGNWKVTQTNKTKVKTKSSTVNNSPCPDKIFRKENNTEAEVRRFTDINNIESKLYNSESVFDSETNLSGDKSEDPFFMLEDGHTAYLSSVVKKVQSSKDNEDNSQPNIPSVLSEKAVPMERCEQGTGKGYGGHFKSFQHRKSNETQGLNRRERRRQASNQQKNKGNTFEKRSAPTGADSAIHPSWEAKKKLREQQQVVFQGKKIKFNDD